MNYLTGKHDFLRCLMPRKEDRWQNIEEILSFWDNENQIEEEKLQWKGLMKVVVPEGVRSIGYDAFGVCEQLKSVTLPQSLKSIERGVFWRCSSLDSIRIPRNVHEIGQFCLMECNSLKDVYDEAQEPQRVVKLFGKATASHVTLHVPAISLEAYKNAECWNEVKCIVPTPGK